MPTRAAHRHAIAKAGLRDVAPLAFITAEPLLGHVGLGGVSDSQQRWMIGPRRPVL